MTFTVRRLARTLAPSLAALAAATVLAGGAHAQQLSGPTAGGWSGSIAAGVDVSVGGDVHGGVDAPVADLGALNPALAGVSATLEIEARSFDDVYDTGATFEVEAAYGLSSDAEVFGAVRYSTLDEGSVQVGGANVPALNTTLPVFGQFGEVSSIGVEAGYRRYFGVEGAMRPYVAGRAGVAQVDAVNATFTVPDADITIANARFYGDSTVFTAGVDVGVMFPVGDRGAVGVETGVRYASSLEDDDSDIGGLGLASINNEGARWSVPVMVRGRIAF